LFDDAEAGILRSSVMMRRERIQRNLFTFGRERALSPEVKGNKNNENDSYNRNYFIYRRRDYLGNRL
jgi:hypothetical protein